MNYNYKLRPFEVIALIILGILAAAFYTDTRQAPWTTLRSGVTADDTALDGTTSSYTFVFSDRPSSAKEINYAWNGIDVFFSGTDAADETCNYKVYLYKSNGPAILWCNGVYTLGAAVTGETTTYFADTITCTNVHGNAEVKDSGNDRVAVLRLGDVRGFKFVFCEIDIPASSQVASASADMTGY